MSNTLNQIPYYYLPQFQKSIKRKVFLIFAKNYYLERQDWYSLIRILNERQASDEETLIFGITVINKTLNGVPDQVN